MMGRYSVYNLGTGVGYSVLEMVKAMEAAAGKAIPYAREDFFLSLL